MPYKDPKIRRETNKAYGKVYRQKLKREVLAHYGKTECACCGETLPDLLTIDHIKGGGNQHRKSLGFGGTRFLIWLRTNNFPKGYRVLCWSCNYGTYINNGTCPHQNAQPL